MSDEKAETLSLIEVFKDLRIGFVEHLHNSSKDLHILQSFDQLVLVFFKNSNIWESPDQQLNIEEIDFLVGFTNWTS